MDGGASWQHFEIGYRNNSVLPLAVDPHGAVFAGACPAWGPAMDRYGIYRSSDTGETWERTGTGGFCIHDIAFNDRGDIFAVSADTLYRSTDDGETWVAVTGHLGALGATCVVTDPRGAIFTGTGTGLLRSIDNGASWERIRGGLAERTGITCLAVNPAGHLFAGVQDHGIFRSTEGGETWEQAGENLADAHIYDLAVHPSGTICASSSDGALSISVDNGIQWNRIGQFSQPVRCITFDVSDHILVVPNRRGVWRSIRPVR
jgi:photosystem II stability/assembly factor-like uncharacterized protein